MSGTRRDRPLLVVARSMTAPRAPGLRNRAFHHEPRVGDVDEIPHPQTSELAEAEAGEAEHEGDVGVATRARRDRRRD